MTEHERKNAVDDVDTETVDEESAEKEHNEAAEHHHGEGFESEDLAQKGRESKENVAELKGSQDDVSDPNR